MILVCTTGSFEVVPTHRSIIDYISIICDKMLLSVRHNLSPNALIWIALYSSL